MDLIKQDVTYSNFQFVRKNLLPNNPRNFELFYLNGYFDDKSVEKMHESMLKGVKLYWFDLQDRYIKEHKSLN